MLASTYPIDHPVSYDPGKYFFKNSTGDEYEILFACKKNNYSHTIVSFNLKDWDDCYRLTNKGDAFRVLATVVNAVKNYLAENSHIVSIEFSGERKVDEDANCITQRTKVFQRYIPYVFNLNSWKFEVLNNSVVISKRGV